MQIKRYLTLALASGLAMLLVPLCMNGAALRGVSPSAVPENETSLPPALAAAEADDVIAVYMPAADETQTLPLRDYVIGCVAAEMPAAYEADALRAQAAASATLARYMRLHPRGDETLRGAVIAADPARYQGYFSVAEMRERWGEDFEAYYEKICAAVDETLPYVLCYGGEPIVAAFHAVSSGFTESAETVWGKEIPYLTGVESEGDRLCPGYASEKTASPEEFRQALGLSPGDTPPDAWLGEASYSEAGTLLSLQICGKQVEGAAVRRAFSLRSPAVRIRYNGNNFVMEVTGYGHGVGMSQYGADYYARQGWSWREILQHYYPGAQLVPTSGLTPEG